MYCMECDHSYIIEDPDPYDDRFSDDVALVCRRILNDIECKDVEFAHSSSLYKCINVSLRLTDLIRVVDPVWCPLLIPSSPAGKIVV